MNAKTPIFCLFAAFLLSPFLLCAVWLIFGGGDQAEVQKSTSHQTEDDLLEGEYRVTQEEADQLNEVRIFVRDRDGIGDLNGNLREFFFQAAQNCHKAVLRQLIAEGMDFSMKNHEGQTAADIAREAGCHDLFELTDYPESLVIAPKAYSILFYPDSFGGRTITYIVEQTYPAQPIVDTINLNLKELGVEVLRESWLNPGIPTSHVRGWTWHVDNTREARQHVFNWSGSWQDEDGNIVDYTLSYRQPYRPGTPRAVFERRAQTLGIVASWTPAERVRELCADLELGAGGIR